MIVAYRRPLLDVHDAESTCVMTVEAAERAVQGSRATLVRGRSQNYRRTIEPNRAMPHHPNWSSMLVPDRRYSRHPEGYWILVYRRLDGARGVDLHFGVALLPGDRTMALHNGGSSPPQEFLDDLVTRLKRNEEAAEQVLLEGLGNGEEWAMDALAEGYAESCQTISAVSVFGFSKAEMENFATETLQDFIARIFEEGYRNVFLPGSLLKELRNGTLARVREAFAAALDKELDNQEECLLIGLRAGDVWMQREFYATYRKKLEKTYRKKWGWMRDDFDSSILEALAIFNEKVCNGSYSRKLSIIHFLRRVAHNVLVNTLTRKRRTEPKDALEDHDLEKVLDKISVINSLNIPTPEDKDAWEVEKRNIARCINAISHERQRLVLTYRYILGLRPKDIADVFAVKQSSINRLEEKAITAFLAACANKQDSRE